jgi:sortase A
VRVIVRGVGEVFITLGAVLLLMVVYQLWWTNVEAAGAIAQGRADIEKSWSTPSGAPTRVPTADYTPAPMAQPAYGVGFGLLYIPRMRDKVWGLPIHEGVGKDVLAQGAGHYPSSVMPGDVGNFAIAAHRSGHGEPFAGFADLQAGDRVYIQTRDTWYTYRLTQDDPHLSPSDVWVVDPVPGNPTATPSERLLTMTTCTPRYGSTGRWAWWGDLVATSPTSAGPPDHITPAS